MKAKLVKDFLQEGVADKYAEKEFHIPDPKYYQEIQAKKGEIGSNEIVGTVINTFYNTRLPHPATIYKNPKIKTLNMSVRGIILKNGDMYMSSNASTIHYDITKFLHDKGIISSDWKGWEDLTIEDPEFIAIQRIDDTNIVALGESYCLDKRDKDVREEQLLRYQPFFDKASKTHPDIKFINENIHRVKLRNDIKDEYANFE